MGMWRSKTLVLWAILCCDSLPGAAESFTIRSPAAIGRIEVRYFLTGTFGGYGGRVRDSDEDGSYRIPLFVDPQTERVGEKGTPAESLKAILYAPGCQFNLLSVDLKATIIRTATFTCTPLPYITLNGRISPPVPDPERTDVKIEYMASWDHRFFGFFDGVVQEFSIGNTRPAADGRFQVEVPDFSRDGVTTKMQDASLLVMVIEQSGGDRVQMAVPPADLQVDSVGLKILPHYDSEVSFSFRPPH